MKIRDADLAQAVEDSYRLGVGTAINLTAELAGHPWLDDSQRAVLDYLTTALRDLSARFAIGTPHNNRKNPQ